MGGQGSRGVIGNKGGGRHPIVKTYSDAIKKRLMKALDRKAKETGKTLEDALVELVYVQNKMPLVKLGAIKAVLDILVTKESKSIVEKIEVGPSIELPPIKKRDEAIVPILGKDFVN
jgi:hypothetical protein